ncbi:transcriptional repressor [Acidiferrimicrobium sp. IK]|uniref:Fur family transcriptional regulator n=1 Tax=Acidiferrimicrobium sp. IK TaxID=2871700 RepID=UPI0021CB1768|nr:transcriptional repressor [Acidiferrimicrobium sp. IK]MCU4182829.1 transcriptional repressor [Acidiferrimicrobium sp. IK]
MTTRGATAPADDDLHELAAARLRTVDQRYTSGRRAIVDLLAGAGRPVSIADIAELRPDLARSSAYRHLMDLQVAGVVRKLAADDEFARFELAEDLTEHHHHLLCVSCGAVTDVSPSATLEKAIGRALCDLAAAEGFEISSHRLDAVGVCRDCR